MKRDMDLVRLILQAVEERQERSLNPLLIDGYSDDQIQYHIELLDEAGLLSTIDLSTTSEHDFRPKRLTWEGHEFVEASRPESRWNLAKEKMGQLGGFSMSVMKQVLIDLMKNEASGLF